MPASKLDAVYRSILLTKFFTKGWGKPENLRRLFEFRKVVSNRDQCYKLIDRDYPVTITKEQNLTDCKLIEGYFITPLERYLPGIVPEVAQKAHFQAVFPLHWPEPGCKPVCLHHAGTGDHFFWRRRNLMVKPLLKEAGIGGIILENPFYGLRKPTDQVRSSLHNVSDILVMGGCLILESLVLFHWCARNGLGPLGVTGLSMGGHMASLAATNWPEPLVLVPCLSWSTASAVFLQGVMSHSINWDLLEDQYLSDGEYREKLSKMVTIVDEAFLAGKKFAQKFSEIHKETQHTDTQESKVANKLQLNNYNKSLDITYKETNGAKCENNAVSNHQFDPKTTDMLNTVDQYMIPNLEGDFKKFVKEKKISNALYEKLISNAKFKLEPHEIDEINKFNHDNVKQEILLKFKIVPHSNALDDIKLVSKTKVTLKETDEKVEETTTGTPNKPAEVQNIIKEDKKPWTVSDLTHDLWMNLSFLKPKSERKIDIGKIHWRDREALQFMRGIMDECTHLSNFSVPYDTSLIIAVCATHDAYVPRVDVGALEEIWPGAEVRYVSAGHVSAYLLHQSVFRACIKEAFERSKKRWKDGKHID